MLKDLKCEILKCIDQEGLYTSVPGKRWSSVSVVAQILEHDIDEIRDQFEILEDEDALGLTRLSDGDHVAILTPAGKTRARECP